MDIRKIAVLGSFAAGAALALAPLAAATPTDPLISVVGSEESLLNSLFVSDATLANVPAGDYSLVDGFDVINAAKIATDAPATAPFSILDYELYGINPAFAGPASDPGAYNVFNGALTEFDNAYNTELFSLLNPTAAIGTIPLTDLFGTASGISEALAFGTASGAVTDFLTDGWNDLLGFSGI